MLPLMGPLESLSTQFEANVQSPDQVSADMLFVPVFQDQDALADLPTLDAAAGGEIGRARSSGEFRGRPYELFITRLVDDRWNAARVALVGAGPRNAWDAERLRRVAAACSYTATLRSVESVAFVVRGTTDRSRAAQAASDGLSAAEFDQATYKSRDAAGGALSEARGRRVGGRG